MLYSQLIHIYHSSLCFFPSFSLPPLSLFLSLFLLHSHIIQQLLRYDKYLRHEQQYLLSVVVNARLYAIYDNSVLHRENVNTLKKV